MIKNITIEKKILFISNRSNKGQVGGRKNLSNLNEKVLKNIFRENFFTFKLEKKKIISLKNIVLALTGNIDGVDNLKIQKIKKIIKKKQITHVFIDGSNLGKISRKISNNSIKIITFCHNVETNFFLKKLKTFFNFRNFYILLINFLTEFQSVYFSNYLIYLNNRDKQMMEKYFYKKNFFIVPMCIDDNFKKYKNSINKNKFLLFVGSNFFGNVSGLEWYINKIVNKIKLKTYVIGKNLNRKKFISNPKIIFKGYVKNLNQYYKEALFIVAPIFKGSGMKTKVAESLMYGKHVIGLKEAFVGYEKFETKIGIKCIDENDFVEAINKFSERKHYFYEPKLRKIYIENFSNNKMKNSYEKIFGKI